MDKLPNVTPQQLKNADAHVGIIHLVSGSNAEGQECHAYISVKPSLYEEFFKKMKKGEAFEIEHYGKILHKGFGLKPTDDERHYVEDQFGVDHDLVQGLTET